MAHRDLVRLPLDAEWTAYAGHYRPYSLFLSNLRIVLRKGEPRLIYPWGDERVLVPEGGARFQTDETVPVRLEFDEVVAGKSLCVRMAGAPYYRFFTP
jgi:hypothetical protein